MTVMLMMCDLFVPCTIYGPGPGCIKPSQDKRALNFCSETITYCFEIKLRVPLILRCFKQPDPGKL